jgi:hypothetical protein
MRAILPITAALMLGACVTAAVPPALPVLEFAANDCTDAPDLAQAISLIPKKESALHVVAAPIGSASSCLARPDQRTAYVLFEVPADHADKTLTVGGQLEALRVLSPHVETLDAQGQTVRRFADDEFMYRGPNFSVLFRPRETERYVLVGQNPARVGQTYDSIAIGVSTTPVYTGYGTANWNTGVDTAQSRTFSYEGVAMVTVNDSDTDEQQ